MALYVNGELIEQEEVLAEAEKLRPRYEQVFSDMAAEEREEQLLEWAQENMVEAVLMRQAAEKTIEPPGNDVIEQAYRQVIDQSGGDEAFFGQGKAEPEQEQQIKEDLAVRFRVEKLIARLTGDIAAPSDKEIARYYEQNIDKYTIPEMVRASHIVKHPTPSTDSDEVRVEMEEILNELRAGGDFAAIASRSSDCPENGGDLGFFARGQMVQQFDDVVFDLAPGQVSDIFTTEFGQHIAVVTDKKKAVPCPLDEVREVIKKELVQESQQKAIEKFVDAEKVKAVIEDK